MSPLPFELPIELPGGDAFAPIDGWEAIEGTPLAWISSYCEEGKSLLLSQFRDRPFLEAVLCALSDGVQDLENAGWQVLTERWLDTATGAQLDRIGDLVDLERRGWGDETYRAFLRAQVLVLRSFGTWPDLFGIMRVVGIDLALVTFAEHYPAAFSIVLGEPLSAFTGADLFDLFERARSITFRLVLEFPVVDVDETFTWADADVEQADTARGWADDTSTYGGYWADALASTETL